MERGNIPPFRQSKTWPIAINQSYITGVGSTSPLFFNVAPSSATITQKSLPRLLLQIKLSKIKSVFIIIQEMMKKLQDNDDFAIRSGKNAVRKAFGEVISTSKENGTLVCGIYNVAEVLQWEDTANIQFCILVKSEDPADQVFYRLIEAYCWENGVKIIKVDCGATLTAMIDESSEKILHCMLVMKPIQGEEINPVLSLLNNYIKYTATWSILEIS